jgi:hypothetical protein
MISPSAKYCLEDSTYKCILTGAVLNSSLYIKSNAIDGLCFTCDEEWCLGCESIG